MPLQFLGAPVVPPTMPKVPKEYVEAFHISLHHISVQGMCSALLAVLGYTNAELVV